jgi:hypothetical protein
MTTPTTPKLPIEVIGIDPDSEAHGVAIYRHGALEQLERFTLPQIMDYITTTPRRAVYYFGIENIMTNKFLYSRNDRGGRSVLSKIAMDVGRNKQAMLELVRMLDYYQTPYMLYPPTARKWAKNPKLFVECTGWSKRSNVDTRSAAYFGYLLTKEMNPTRTPADVERSVLQV